MTTTPESWLSEFTANLVLAEDQRDPVVTGLSNGNFLVSWTDDNSGAGSNGSDIIGVIFDPLGNALTGSLFLNSPFGFSSDESDHSVAARSDGGFAIVYMFPIGGSTSIIYGIYNENGLRGAFSGPTVGADFVVNNPFGSGIDYSNPSIAVGADDSLFITYEKSSGANQDIAGKKISADGTTVGAEVTLREDTFAGGAADNENLVAPQTVALAGGGFATVFLDNDDNAGVAERTLEVRISNADGTNSTLINNVSTPDGEPDANPRIAALPDGRFLVAWDEGGDLRGAIYNANGTVDQADFTITNNSGLPFRLSDIIALEDNSYFVLFEDTTENRLFGFRRNDTGQIGITIFIDPDLPGELDEPASLDLTSDGRILITWGKSGDIQTAIYDLRDNAITVDPTDGVTTGTQQADTITGSDQNDTIFGVGGADSIVGGSGEDSIDGGTGDDSIDGGAENDIIFGGVGNDSLEGGVGNDTLDGSDGTGTLEAPNNDTLRGGTGDDLLIYSMADTGSDAINLFDGGADTDTLSFTSAALAANRTANLATGEFTFNDTLGTTILRGTIVDIENVTVANAMSVVGDNNANVITGIGDFDNTFDGGGGNDTIDGGGGSDTLSGGSGSDSVSGGDGADTLFADASGSNAFGTDTLLGEAGNDSLVGSNGRQEISGGTGDDTLRGGDDGGTADTDTLRGGDNDDLLISGQGAVNAGKEGNGDLLFGDDGNDTLIGGEANDVLSGGAGSDSLTGGVGDDTLYADESGSTAFGSDTLLGEAGNDSLVGSNGRQLLEGGTGDDTLRGGDDGGTADTDTLRGGDDDDLLMSGQGTVSAGREGNGDLLFGDDGNDTLIGGDANDSLLGGVGNDSLEGGAGNDTLDGSDGTGTPEAPNNDTLRGGTGDDLLIFSREDTSANSINLFDGGDDTDTLSFTSADLVATQTANLATGEFTFGTTVVRGTIVDIENVTVANAMSVVGDNNANVITGIGDFDNTFDGGGGNDTIDGGGGSDTLSGGSGSDSVSGGDGNDTIFASAEGSTAFGTDTLLGEAGNDSLVGSNGRQEISGGTGDDTLRGGDDGGTADTDTLRGGDNDDLLISGQGAVNIGLEGNGDLLFGDDGNDTLIGGDANDSLLGGKGDDSLEGGAGNDTLDGSDGTGTFETPNNDTLRGGTGDDLLIFSVADTDSDAINLFDGGADTDTLSFTSAALTANRTANLATGELTLGTTILRGTIVDIENVTVANAMSVVGDNNANVITGIGDFDNTFDGGGGNDTIDGGGGSDTLSGGAGSDSVSGGEGNDTIFASADGANDHGTDTLLGDAGDDSLVGANGTQLLEGGIGNDTLTGGRDGGTADVDTLRGGDDDDLLMSGQGTVSAGREGNGDLLFGDDGNDTLIGGEANDVLSGGADSDSLSGGLGDDTIFASADGANDHGNDTLLGDAGNDSLVGANGTQLLEGGIGNDTLTGGRDGGTADIDTLRGGDDDDLLMSGQGTVSAGREGNGDLLFGDDGNDTLIGGEANDVLSGGADSDSLSGGLGDDTIFASADGANDHGNDTLLGDAGNDSLVGANGTQLLEGGIGNDTVTGGRDGGTADIDTLRGGDDDDLLISGQGTVAAGREDSGDLLFGDDGNDTLIGGEANDVLSGGADSDSLTGGVGDDTLYADESGSTAFGSDTLLGEAGNDSLVGSNGRQLLEGGTGDDTLRGGDDGGTADTDTLRGGDNDDLLISGQGAVDMGREGNGDLLFGDDGNDTLIGGDANDSLLGGKGDDSLEGGAGNDTLDGSDGTGTLTTPNNDTLRGGTGDDLLIYSMADTRSDAINLFDGGADTDTLSFTSTALPANRTANLATGELTLGTTILRGTIVDIENVSVASAISVVGDSNANVITGTGDFDNTFDGGGSGDTIDGGGGNDTLSGGSGSDSVSGGDGADTLFADASGSNAFGTDTLLGEAGNDSLVGSNGRQLLEGGIGDDTLRGGDDGGTADTDTLRGGDDDDLLMSGQGAVDTGREGNGDLLFGDGGNDTLIGGEANDTLSGGSGNDSLTGGFGEDTFVFLVSTGSDTVTSYDLGIDELQLDDALWLGTHGVLTEAQVVSTFATDVGADVVLDFGGGDVVLLRNVPSTTGLEDDITIF